MVTGVSVHLLELDPELGEGVAADEWDSAHEACRGPLLRLPRGPWDASEVVGPRDDVVGLLIVEGLVCREITLGPHQMLELLGAGDVLVPPPPDDGAPRLTSDPRFTAATKTTIVVLAGSYIRAACRWPTLLAAVQRRLEAQREQVTLQGLIAHLPRADHRVLLTLWRLASRWGYVTPAGTRLPLPLTHGVLGQLSAARRPTTTLAVRTLESAGSILRLEDGSWVVTPAGDRRIRAIAHSPAGTPRGQTFMLARLIAETSAQARAVQAEARQIRRAKPSRRDGGRPVP
jgi:hypothetical protein